ncbi:hypothetical protein N7490_008367 [Penicillium lividum]|nr:hypothetical protein N7490_008367 [Penicillium lividum]
MFIQILLAAYATTALAALAPLTINVNWDDVLIESKATPITTPDWLWISNITNTYPVDVNTIDWNYDKNHPLGSTIAVLGIDAVGGSQLSGYPGQYPSAPMVDYHTGLPTARLLCESSNSYRLRVAMELRCILGAFEINIQERKILLVNKLDQTVVEVNMRALQGRIMEILNLSSEGNIWQTEHINGGSVSLTPYATAVLTES